MTVRFESTTMATFAAVIIVSVKNASVDELEQHIRELLPRNSVHVCDLARGKGRRTIGKITLHPSISQKGTKVKQYAKLLRTSKLRNNSVYAQVDPSLSFLRSPQETAINVEPNRKTAAMLAPRFFIWLNGSTSVNLTSVDRDQVHCLFEEFVRQLPLESPAPPPGEVKRLESMAMALLKQQKLYKFKRYGNGGVVCSFARSDHSFAPLKDRKIGRDQLVQQEKQLQADKCGVRVQETPVVTPSLPVVPINTLVSIELSIQLANKARAPIQLTEVKVAGPQKADFKIQTSLPRQITDSASALKLSFRAKRTGVFRSNILLYFQDSGKEKFTILRRVLLRSGDADMYEILKPTSPYQKKQRKKKRREKPNRIFDPPGKGAKPYKNLNPFKPPTEVRNLLQKKKMEAALVAPTYDTTDGDLLTTYPEFWQNMLWVTELQASEDIKLFDMENVILQRSGKFFQLTVDGLAEGRPSVLKGDTVKCTWKGNQYTGRVEVVERLDVKLEFHRRFHDTFDVNLDVVDLIRFTFTRTTFRTSHAGVLQAPENMGPTMLFPQIRHAEAIRQKKNSRALSAKLNWASETLNEEQRHAVTQIAKGSLRPMPYVVFGPPGTGKTTTLVEAVFQLSLLPQPPKILLIAPSNDAADIHVEKLSQYFPPSEMLRALAYSRTMDQVPKEVRPYVREGLTGDALVAAIQSVKIVISTVNLAARFWCSGVPRGHFGVLIVDEAGHSIEPEVVAVAATLMDFGHQTNPGQLVLAGDPMQLGPIVSSDICKRFGMSVSFMERLILSSPAYAADGQNDTYPPDLVTILVRNYRSHPAILKLPNEMFYHSKLKPVGNPLSTHSMTRWEHLPQSRFPVVFHAVEGENLREGSSPSWYNLQEVEQVVKYVNLLVKESRPAIQPNQIGIITPYARQVQKIRLALRVFHGDAPIKVGSVETFQGQERQCIIVSTVRAETEHLAHDLKYNLGFVSNEKRFNVALTRPKALLVVIGSPRVLATDTEHWLPLLRYCKNNGGWMGAPWDEQEEGLLGANGLSSSSDEDEEDPEHPSAAVEQEAIGFINREE